MHAAHAITYYNICRSHCFFCLAPGVQSVAHTARESQHSVNVASIEREQLTATLEWSWIPTTLDKRKRNHAYSYSCRAGASPSEGRQAIAQECLNAHMFSLPSCRLAHKHKHLGTHTHTSFRSDHAAARLSLPCGSSTRPLSTRSSPWLPRLHARCGEPARTRHPRPGWQRE